jgi:hypothetical protein
VVDLVPVAPSGRNRQSERDMTINDHLKLKFVSLALTLALAAVLATSVAAEDAASPPSSDAKAKAIDSAAHSPDSLPAGNNSAPASGGSNTEDIDTRISVQPHGPPPGRSGGPGGATNPIAPLKLINPHRRAFSPSRAAHRFTPNASGVPGPQRQNGQNLGQRLEYKGLGQSPVTGGTGGIGGGGLGLEKPGSNLGRQQILQPTGVPPVAGGSKTLIRGGISGASLNRRAVGSGVAGIGGPARTLTGINGTSIKAR